MSEGAIDEWPFEKAGEFDGVAIDEWPFEKAGEFDGVVGFPLESAEGPPSQSSQVYVAAPHGPSGSWAMGLEDDVRLLARAFAAGGTDLCRELIKGLPPRSSGTSRSPQQKEGVHVALHGLELDSSDEEELRDLIWTLVEKRVEGGGVRP
jgi:hypothetical protein